MGKGKIVTKEDEIGEYNKTREKYERLCKYYEGAISSILSDINILKAIKSNSEKMDGLINIAPYFFQNACVNSWFAIIVKLARLFADPDTKIIKLLNLVEYESEKIYIRNYYYAIVLEGESDPENDSNEWILKERKDLPGVIIDARKEIEENVEKIKQVTDIRDKQFAHFDKEMLDPDSRAEMLKTIDLELVESLARTAENIFCSVAYYDSFVRTYCTNINSDDVLKLANACNLYCEHKTEILKAATIACNSGMSKNDMKD